MHPDKSEVTLTCVAQLYQKTGLLAVTALRKSFDIVTRYGPKMTEAKWMTRVIFLETIAGAVAPFHVNAISAVQQREQLLCQLRLAPRTSSKLSDIL